MGDVKCYECKHIECVMNGHPCNLCGSWRPNSDSKYFEPIETKKKTLYIDVPVVGRKYSDVMADIRILHEVAENLFGEKLEVLDCYRVEELKNQTLDDLWRHLETHDSADYCISAYANETSSTTEPITE